MLVTGLVVIGVVFIGLFAVRGWQSQTPPVLGLADGHLRACPDKPNCVSSEAPVSDGVHAITPLSATDWQTVREAVESVGGTMVQADDDYLHATFTSRLFRFVDDVELRRDAASGLVHIRSASRVGHSDFGVNRKRVEAIRKLLDS